MQCYTKVYTLIWRKNVKKVSILQLFLPRVVSEKEDVSCRQFCFYAFIFHFPAKVEWASGLEYWILTSVDLSPRSQKLNFKNPSFLNIWWCENIKIQKKCFKIYYFLTKLWKSTKNIYFFFNLKYFQLLRLIRVKFTWKYGGFWRWE